MRHHDARLGAALAYYSVFSLGPLLLIVVSVAGVFFWHRGLATTDLAVAHLILERAEQREIGTVLPYRP